MNRLLRMVVTMCVAACAAPNLAFASTTGQMTPLALHLAVSATGLGVAIVLLLEAVGLRRISLGGVIGDKIHLVILAIVCLGTSALAKWTGNFVTGLTFEQTELVSELLVILAMALLAAYFYAVRAAMQAFVSGVKKAEPAKREDAEGEPDA